MLKWVKPMQDAEFLGKLALQIANTSAVLETLIEDVLDIRARLVQQADPTRDREQIYSELRRTFFEERRRKMLDYLHLLGMAPPDSGAAGPETHDAPDTSPR
jgi:hypothetical protein